MGSLSHEHYQQNFIGFKSLANRGNSRGTKFHAHSYYEQQVFNTYDMEAAIFPKLGVNYFY